MKRIAACLTVLLCCSIPALAAGMDDFIGNWVGDGQSCEEAAQGESDSYLIYKDDLGFGWGGTCEDLKMKIKGDVLTITGVCGGEEEGEASDLNLTVEKAEKGKVQITDFMADGMEKTGHYHRCPFN